MISMEHMESTFEKQKTTLTKKSSQKVRKKIQKNAETELKSTFNKNNSLETLETQMGQLLYKNYIRKYKKEVSSYENKTNKSTHYTLQQWENIRKLATTFKNEVQNSSIPLSVYDNIESGEGWEQEIHNTYQAYIKQNWKKTIVDIGTFLEIKNQKNKLQKSTLATADLRKKECEQTGEENLRGKILSKFIELQLLNYLKYKLQREHPDKNIDIKLSDTLWDIYSGSDTCITREREDDVLTGFIDFKIMQENSPHLEKSLKNGKKKKVQTWARIHVIKQYGEDWALYPNTPQKRYVRNISPLIIYPIIKSFRNEYQKGNSNITNKKEFYKAIETAFDEKNTPDDILGKTIFDLNEAFNLEEFTTKNTLKKKIVAK